MSKDNECIPYHAKYRLLKLLFGLVFLFLGIFLLVGLFVLTVFTVMQGHNPFSTPESICAGIIVWILLPIFLTRAVREIIFKNWIKVGDTEIHLSKSFLWKKIPYKDISEVKKLPDDDLEIIYAGSRFLLTHDDLDDCYDILVSKLQKHGKINGLDQGEKDENNRSG